MYTMTTQDTTLIFKKKKKTALAVSWYAVGCYYYSIGKYDIARRYLSKATSIDSQLGPAWLAFGHSFAAQGFGGDLPALYPLNHLNQVNMTKQCLHIVVLVGCCKGVIYLLCVLAWSSSECRTSIWQHNL